MEGPLLHSMRVLQDIHLPMCQKVSYRALNEELSSRLVLCCLAGEHPESSKQVSISDTAGKLKHSSVLHGDNLSPP